MIILRENSIILSYSTCGESTLLHPDISSRVSGIRTPCPSPQVLVTSRRRRARRQPHASPFSHVSILEEDAVRRRTERAGQMPPRSRENAERISGASPPAPKHVPSPIFLPLPPHPVDRWSREDARAEPVEQLLYGPVQTRRPTLVHAPLGAEAEAALGAEGGSLLLGDGTDMAAAYKAVAYGLRWVGLLPAAGLLTPLSSPATLARATGRWRPAVQSPHLGRDAARQTCRPGGSAAILSGCSPRSPWRQR